MEGSPARAESARKHGTEDDDILHAFAHAIRVEELDDGLVMLVGPNRTASELLEVGVVDSRDGPVIVHAMSARPKYLR